MTYATTQQPALPDEVARAAYAAQLGPLTGIHPRAKMLALLIVLWGLTVIMAVVAWNSSDSNASRGDVPIVVPILMVGLPLAGAIWATVMNPVFNPKIKARKVYTVTDGFIEISGKGEVRAHRFGSVAELYQAIVRNTTYGVQTSTNYTYKMIFADGGKTKMTNYTTDMSELGPLIMKGVTNAQLPGAVAAIKAGQTIAFGPATINAHGIATASQPLTPWTQIVKVDVAQGNIRFAQAGKRGSWATFQCAKVPNLYTFLWLTERLVNGGSI
jgi:hypothetical protein